MRTLNVLVAGLLVGFGGCASVDTVQSPAPGKELRSFTPGWERFFTIDWQPGTRDGHPVVSGTVKNTYGATATRVQLLVEALDDKGSIMSQRVVWLAGDGIAPFDSARFDVPVERAANYRVTIFAYDQRRGSGSV